MLSKSAVLTLSGAKSLTVGTFMGLVNSETVQTEPNGPICALIVFYSALHTSAGNLTFPSAPSSTPSSPITISLALTPPEG